MQHGHGIATVGSETQGLRTGMERALVARLGPEFAQTATGSGVIVEKDDDHIAVEYKGGEIIRIPLGSVNTNAEGTLYPNQLVSSLEVGDKVKQFDVISYNAGHFKVSPLDKHRVDYMGGCVGRVALREATYTVEDSSSISEAFSTRMLTTVVKSKPIHVGDFNMEISGILEIGDAVDLDTILCTIEDAVSADAGLYDEKTRETLKNWAAMSPRAGVVGKITGMDVYYNGDIEDMSESIQKIVTSNEKRRRRLAKRLGVPYTTGFVNRNVRIDGTSLEADQVLIMFYITTPVGMGIGDKLVVANQCKSTVGEILFGENRTVDGEDIDLIFGAKSFIDRILTSPFGIGSTNTVLRYIGEAGYDMYFNDK